MRFALAFVFAAVALSARAGEFATTQAEDYRIDREQVFEFVKAPAVTREGDRVTVSFETKGFCDVAVAVEDRDGRIIRHVAYGVLGPNAPEPFQKNSKKQAVVWDGKNELGVYVEDLDGVRVRVSLGLKPQLERTLFWHPKKRMALMTVPRVVAQPEGVYVYDGGGPDCVKLFGHDGKYIRTICPFPAEDAEKVKGLPWYSFADGYKAPRRRGEFESTFMTGDNQGAYEYGHAFPARGFTVRDGSIASVRKYLCRLGTGDSVGKHKIYGPEIPNWPAQSLALSPDKKWLYLTGFYRNRNWLPGESGLVQWKHNVMRMAFDGDEPPKNWLGDPNKPGSDDKHFTQPSDIEVDSEGRVYVADSINDRVQIFSPDGKLLKSLPMRGPAFLDFHHKTGELYAFCFSMQMVKKAYDRNHHRTQPALRVFRPFESDKPVVQIPIPFEANWSAGSGMAPTGQVDECPVRIALDSYTDPPMVWINTGSASRRTPPRREQISLFRIEDNKKLVLVERWNDIVEKALNHWRPRDFKRGRMFVDPRNGALYIAGENGNQKALKSLYRIDPSTGQQRTIDLPYLAEDIAIDDSGHIYLRCGKLVGRFELDSMREIPYDYGERRVARWYGPGGPAPREWQSLLIIPGTPPGFWHESGMGVTPRGELVVATYNATKPVAASSLFGKGHKLGGARYRPKVYPGRVCALEIHVFDKHGKVVVKDAVKGLPNGHGTLIDPMGDIYFLASAARVYRGKPFYWNNGTLMKFQRGKGKLYATARAQIPLSANAPALKGLPVIDGGAYRRMYVEGAEWLYPGVGFCHPAGSPCECMNARFAVDHFGRAFAPEFARQQVAVLDTAGNLVLHVGRYGNIDDGVPLFANPNRDKRYPPRSIGGDEVALAYANYVATHSDRRLFIYDGANDCVRSVKLDYHTTETVALKP
jgi:hypothetical protein